jgi:CHAT domain-containing protein
MTHRRSRNRLKLVVLAILAAVLCTAGPGVAMSPASIDISQTPTAPDTANPAIASDALDQEGRRLYEAQRYDEAIAVLQRAIQAYRQQNNRSGQAMAYRNLALVYQAQGNWAEASQAIATSRDLLQSVDEPNRLPILARVLDVQGTVQLHQGQTEQAFATWQEAVDLYRQLGDDAAALRSQINQAQALQSLGFYRRAIATLTPLADTLRQQPDSLMKVVALRSLGDALQAAGTLTQARTVLEESLTTAQALQLAPEVGATYFSLANVARAQGDTQAALEFYRRASSATISPLLQVQLGLNRLRLRMELGQWSAAQAEVEAIAQQLQQLPASQAATYAQVNFAQALMTLAEQQSSSGASTPTQPLESSAYAAIAQRLTLARQQAQTIQDKRSESFAVGLLANLYEKRQQWDDAKTLTEEALVLAQTVNAPDIAYRWQWQLGRVLKQSGDPENAIAAYGAAIDSLKILRNDLVAVSPEVQLSFRDSIEPLHREFVSLLLAPNSTATPQENLGKARTVIESLQLAELDNFFREACLDANPIAIDQIDPQAAVLYPIILDDRVEVIVRLPQEDLRHFATPIPRSQLEGTVSRLRQLLVTLNSRQFLPLTQQLYDWLIRPVEADLANSNAKTLVFVLDGSLRNIPMAALYDGQRYLVEKYDVALTPGLQLLDPRPLTRGKLNVLTAGLTEARQGFSALPNVLPEVESIQSEIPGRTLLNQQFTEPELEKAIAESAAPIVHLATHGKFGSTFDQTFILTWDNRIDINKLSGLLQEADQTQSNPIELLVLSACETAAGDNLAALGLAGMAVRAGARSTLATLWQVSDEATSVLMQEFYNQILNAKITKADALRQAQLKVLSVPQFRQHPYYWAPYVVVGNWL